MRTRLLVPGLAALGTLAALLPADAEPLVRMGSWASVTPVGDLDGDGVDDLVDYRVSADVDPANAGRQVTVTVHRGRDGKVLWQHVVTKGGLEQVRPTRLPSGPGVLLVLVGAMGTIGTGESTLVGDRELTALDRKGAVAWTTSLAGLSQRTGEAGAFARTYAAQPYVAAVGQYAKGPAEDVAVAVVDEVRTPAGAASRLTASIVDGATGASRVAATVVEPTAALRLVGLPDLDRDGLADLGVARVHDGVASLAAHATRDGAELWRSPTMPVGGVLAVSAGDTDGDRVPDVLVSPADTHLEYQYSSPMPGAHTLLDGRTGRRRWARVATSAHAVGDVGRNGRSDVVLLEDAEPTEAVVTAYALDGAGRRLWHVRRSLPRASSERALPFKSLAIAGDVDADGVLDVAYRLEVAPVSGPARVDSGVVSGRTGRRSSRGSAAGSTLARSVDGRGADFVQVDRVGGLLVTTVTRGDTGALLWRTSVRLPGGFGADSGHSTVPGRLGRDGCGDVVVTADDGSQAVSVAFSGADGVPLWSLTRASSETAVVGRPKPADRVDRNACR